MESRCLLFVTLTWLVGLSYAQEPMLVLELSANTVTAGEQLVANCTATTTTQSRVLYINNVSVVDRIPADRLSSDSDGMTTTWTIDPVQREDAGEYYCFAGGDQTSHSDSLRQNVTVYFGPIFSHDGQEQENGASINITAVEASDLTINCNVTASNPAVTSLTLTNPPACNVNFDNSTGAITIGSFTVDNEGNYTCSADNGVTMPTNISFVLMLAVSSSSVQMSIGPVTPVLPSTSPVPVPQAPSTRMPQASSTQMPQGSSTPQTSAPPSGAGNVLASLAVITLTLLAALLLS